MGDRILTWAPDMDSVPPVPESSAASRSGERLPLRFAAALRVLAASRVHKLIPLLVLMANAALMAGEGVSRTAYGIAVAFVLLSSMLGMQLNVLTDAALDRSTKPHLIAWLTEDPRVLRALMWVEGMTCGLLVLLIAPTHPRLALALSYYAACFLLYSYNFLIPGGQARARFKVFWWGNLLTVLGGYASLWVAGFALGGLPNELWPMWLGLGAALCAVDYGVFMNECAGDADAERANDLKTLPALLGKRLASVVAMALLSAGAAALLALLGAFWTRLDVVRVAALLWHAAVQTAAALLTLLVVRRGRSRWETLVDSSFWISRLGALAILTGQPWLSN
jgi:4-hydroxybenzoate polyprenyltransferase